MQVGKFIRVCKLIRRKRRRRQYGPPSGSRLHCDYERHVSCGTNLADGHRSPIGHFERAPIIERVDVSRIIHGIFDSKAYPCGSVSFPNFAAFRCRAAVLLISQKPQSRISRIRKLAKTRSDICMSNSLPELRGLVVSAHSADFIWRAGGAIALYAKRGWKIKVVCLSFGEKGESQKLWKEPGMTVDRVKAARQVEAEKAGQVLGVSEFEFFDLGDYPLRTNLDALERLADIYQELRPSWVLTHSLEDPYNLDHPEASRFAQEARIVAQAHGRRGACAAISAPPVFLFEPHQTEQCNWKPQVILDISEVWEIKRKAFEQMDAQEHLWEYYTRVAMQRGVQGARNSERKMKYGEAYQRVYPLVTENLI